MMYGRLIMHTYRVLSLNSYIFQTSASGVPFDHIIIAQVGTYYRARNAKQTAAET